MVSTLAETPREWHNLSGARTGAFSVRLYGLQIKIEQLLRAKNNSLHSSWQNSHHKFTSCSGLPQRQTTTALLRFPTRPSKPQHVNPQNQACYYHRKCGDQAHKCVPTCTWNRTTIRHPVTFVGHALSG